MDQFVTSEGTRDRRIALLKPRREQDAKSSHAMQLFSSMLWAFKGATRSSWETASANDADVVVFHAEDGRDDDVSQWQASGKLAVVITTDLMSGPATKHALVYPFRAAQVLQLLEHLDAELRLVERTRDNSIVVSHTVAHRNVPSGCWAFSEALRELRVRSDSTASWMVASRDEHPLIWVNSRGATYFAESHTVAAIRNGTMSFRGLVFETGPPPRVDAVPRPASELSWFTAFYADGELINGVPGSARHRIVRWPDFGSIRPPARQVHSLAVLATQYVNVNELAARARITATEAVRTLNALIVHGSLTSCETGAPQTFATSGSAGASAGALSNLLTRIRRRLGLGA